MLFSWQFETLPRWTWKATDCTRSHPSTGTGGALMLRAQSCIIPGDNCLSRHPTIAVFLDLKGIFDSFHQKTILCALHRKRMSEKFVNQLYLLYSHTYGHVTVSTNYQAHSKRIAMSNTGISFRHSCSTSHGQVNGGHLGCSGCRFRIGVSTMRARQTDEIGSSIRHLRCAFKM